MGNIKYTHKHYFSVKDPSGTTRTILAETKFEAIARAIEKDNGKYTYKQYSAKRTK